MRAFRFLLAFFQLEAVSSVTRNGLIARKKCKTSSPSFEWQLPYLLFGDESSTPLLSMASSVFIIIIREAKHSPGRAVDERSCSVRQANAKTCSLLTLSVHDVRSFHRSVTIAAASDTSDGPTVCKWKYVIPLEAPRDSDS